MKLTYEQDLFPGEYFGEIALEGLHHRAVTVQALTDVDLLSIEHVCNEYVLLIYCRYNTNNSLTFTVLLIKNLYYLIFMYGIV